MILLLLQAGENTSGHFQAGRVVGMVVMSAIMLIVVVAIVKMVIRKLRSGHGGGNSPSPGETGPQVASANEAAYDTEPAVLPDTAGHLSAMGKAGSIGQTPAPAGVPANTPTLHPDKGPRASEIPGNPPLPPGEVKIRSLCCNQKMRNQAEKLGKQRRCPKCGVAPFRYKLEPVGLSPPA